MAKQTDLEKRIRWYLKEVEDFIDRDALELILLAKWDEQQKNLIILREESQKTLRQKYIESWKKWALPVEK